MESSSHSSGSWIQRVHMFVCGLLGPDWSHQEKDEQADVPGVLQLVSRGAALHRPQASGVPKRTHLAQVDSPHPTFDTFFGRRN